MLPTAIGTTPPTPHTRLTPTRAPRPMALPKGNQQPDPKPLQKTEEQKDMMR